MVIRRALIGSLSLMMNFLPSCAPSPELTEKCKAWSTDDFKKYILRHLQINSPIGDKPSMSLTLDDIQIDGAPRLDTVAKLWSVPFFVPGSHGYNALIECDGYTELSGYSR